MAQLVALQRAVPKVGVHAQPGANLYEKVFLSVSRTICYVVCYKCYIVCGLPTATA